MTLGIDVSRLFSDMMMVINNIDLIIVLLLIKIIQAIETKDIVVKKMIYLYLCNYAHKQPEMAIMCINSLRRDWYGMA